jgi:hypothetical protein
MAKVTNDLVSGKMRPRDVAVVAAIAKRNLSKPDPVAAPPTDVEQWGDELERRLEERYGDQADLALHVALQWLEQGDRDLEDPTIADLSVDELMAHLDSLGDLLEWRTRHDAERTAAWQAQLERNKVVAEQARLAVLTEEDRLLLEAAEQWLAQQAIGIDATDRLDDLMATEP